MKQEEQIVIVGAGLSGLTLAYVLSKHTIYPKILEASSRIGGRIQTIKGTRNTPLELGATWFSNIHSHLISLLDELGIEKFKQYTQGISLFETAVSNPIQQFKVPENQNSSFRISGGTQTLIDTLYDNIPAENIKLNTSVTKITDLDNTLLIETHNGEQLKANKVILCMPPQLISSTIKCFPALPENVQSLLPSVQTWMGGSIKFVIEYASPFWRNKGYSGMVFSHIGIVSEMHDHTNSKENKFGFTGFLNEGAITYTQEDRKKYVLQQLHAILGSEALDPLFYFDKEWKDEYIIGTNPIIQKPHQNNGHHLLQQSYMNDKLFFSGTESSQQFGGYMEGAIVSVKNTYKKLIDCL